VGLKAAPALATGNVFILKPSEKTPLMAAALGRLVLEAGFPPGVFQVLTGDGTTGALLASHMQVAKVSFTGSIQTGKRVQVLAAQSNLKRVTLELGGKSPAVVFEDANLENAVQWYDRNLKALAQPSSVRLVRKGSNFVNRCVNGLTNNSGQICFASTRVYVQESIYKDFIDSYTAKLNLKKKGIGDTEKDGTEIGPVVDKQQFERIIDIIATAKAEGQGKLLEGGAMMGEKVRL
jgi:acyl-CoA reductase-like NAD-dependent aldehyde dehydrogenase